jgi:hypothetical protein
MKNEIKEIKKIGIFSVAKILTLFGILLGILYGVQIGLASNANPLTFADAATYAAQDPTIAVTAYSIALGWWMIILAPIVFAILYYLSGLIGGLVYNWFARMVGGIKIDLE